MRTYPLFDGATLVLSVNRRPPATVIFRRRQFEDITAARADEIRSALGTVDGLVADTDPDGELVLATENGGGHTSLDVDTAVSTAAGALGLTGRPTAQGTGPRPAQLESLNSEPFTVRAGAELTLLVNGRRFRITFDGSVTGGRASAGQVARVIAAKRQVAQPTAGGRILLTSPTIGPESRLEVSPAREGRADAAAALGFVGPAAADWPYRIGPARLRLRPQRPRLAVINLSAGPLPLPAAHGTVVVAAGDTVPISANSLVRASVQRLLTAGTIRLTATGEEDPS